MIVMRFRLIFLYLTFTVIPLAFMAYLALIFEDLFWNTLPEFLATSLGILMSFSMAAYVKSVQAEKRAKQVLKAIKKELRMNLHVVESIRMGIEGMEGGNLFAVFKTNTWEALNSMLSVVGNYELVIDLGELYWEFDSINETIRLNIVGALEAFFPEGVMNGLEGVEQHINDIIADIDREIA